MQQMMYDFKIQQQQQQEQQQQKQQRNKMFMPQNTGPRKKIRSKVSEDHRTEILLTPLPPSLAVRKRHRARVAVKTVQDLRHYIEFVGSLCETHKSYYGHKKAIGELISVSANRINEWLKIWAASNDPQYMTDEVVKIMSHSKVSTLSSLVSALHRSGWSPENTSLPTSFPQVEYTKIEKIPPEGLGLYPPALNLPARTFCDEGSLCDDFENSCPIGIDDCSPLTLSFSPPSYVVISEKSAQKVITDGDIDIELGSPSDLENWFDIVERNFNEFNASGDENTNSSFFLEPSSV